MNKICILTIFLQQCILSRLPWPSGSKQRTESALNLLYFWIFSINDISAKFIQRLTIWALRNHIVRKRLTNTKIWSIAFIGASPSVWFSSYDSRHRKRKKHKCGILHDVVEKIPNGDWCWTYVKNCGKRDIEIIQNCNYWQQNLISSFFTGLGSLFFGFIPFIL